jgi:hypothetical protein
MSKPTPKITRLWILLTNRRCSSDEKSKRSPPRNADALVVVDETAILPKEPSSQIVPRNGAFVELEDFEKKAGGPSPRPVLPTKFPPSPRTPPSPITRAPENGQLHISTQNASDAILPEAQTSLYSVRPSPFLAPAVSDAHAHSPTSVCNHVEKLAKAQKKVARLRDEVLTKRAQVNNEHQIHIQLRDYALEVQDSFVAALDTAILRGTLAADQSAIKDLHKQIQLSNHELHEQEEHFRELESGLSSLEYRLGKQEAAIYSTLCEKAKLAATSAALSTEDEEEDEDVQTKFSSQGLMSEGVPSLLEAYYDRAGDVTIERDRLDEFEAEHRDEVRVRAYKIESGDRLIPSEKKFLESYFERRTKIIRDYLKAKHDTQQLRQQCIERNYHLDKADDIEVQDNPIDLSKRFPEGPLGKGIRPLELLLFGDIVDPEERVQDWLIGSLLAQFNASQRNTILKVGKAQSEGSREPHLGQMPIVEDARTVEGTMDSPVLPRFDAGESSRGVRSSTRPLRWRAEILQRRYSNPDFPTVEPVEKSRPRSVR